MKVISVALFGERASQYSVFLRAFMRGHLNLFPPADGWKLRVHVDSGVAKIETAALIRRYAHAGLCDSVLMYRDGDSPPLCKGMLWRLDPIRDPNVEYVFCRDLDAPPMPRDRAACDQFVASAAALHTIHDSDQHVGIMGGLCGVWTSEFHRLTGLHNLDDLFAFAGLTDGEWSRHGADQVVLNRIVVAHPNLTLLEHRYNGWHNGPGVKPAREAGSYACEAWSTPVPDEGWFTTKNGLKYGFVADEADRLGGHLGCAGYDHEAALSYWNNHGDSEIAYALGACE